MNRQTLLIPILLLYSFYAQAAKEADFCKYVSESDFKKVEKLVRKKIHELRFGTLEYNSSTSYTTFHHELDSICNWLRSKDCVVDAMWDKCIGKISIYPGHSSIGAKFLIGNEVIEKCFLIQEGMINPWNRWLGWIKYFPDKNEMFYQGMSDCPGFVEEQMQYCQEYGMEFSKDSNYVFLEGLWRTADSSEVIEIRLDNHGSGSYLISKSHYPDTLAVFRDRMYQFMLAENESRMELKGMFLAWGGHYCTMKIVSRNMIQMTYPNELGGTLNYFKMSSALKN